jgi:hypothetical protein
MRVWEVIAILEGNHSEFIGGVMSSIVITTTAVKYVWS